MRRLKKGEATIKRETFLETFGLSKDVEIIGISVDDSGDILVSLMSVEKERVDGKEITHDILGERVLYRKVLLKSVKS